MGYEPFRIGDAVYVEENANGYPHWADDTGMVRGRVTGRSANTRSLYIEIESRYGTTTVRRPLGKGRIHARPTDRSDTTKGD